MNLAGETKSNGALNISKCESGSRSLRRAPDSHAQFVAQYETEAKNDSNTTQERMDLGGGRRHVNRIRRARAIRYAKCPGVHESCARVSCWTSERPTGCGTRGSAVSAFPKRPGQSTCSGHQHPGRNAARPVRRPGFTAESSLSQVLSLHRPRTCRSRASLLLSAPPSPDPPLIPSHLSGVPRSFHRLGIAPADPFVNE